MKSSISKKFCSRLVCELNAHGLQRRDVNKRQGGIILSTDTTSIKPSGRLVDDLEGEIIGNGCKVVRYVYDRKIIVRWLCLVTPKQIILEIRLVVEH